MGAMKQQWIRDREARSCEPCAVCESRKWDDLYEQHCFDRDVASRDPCKDPTHREATEAEWRAFFLS